jgi:hypothetical protein
MDGLRDAWLLEGRVKARRIGRHVNHVLYDDDPDADTVRVVEAAPAAVTVGTGGYPRKRALLAFAPSGPRRPGWPGQAGRDSSCASGRK